MAGPGLRRIAARVVAALACGALSVATLELGGAWPRVAATGARAADEDWLAEFEAVCARTQDAMTMSSEELRALLARCERLKPKVEALDPSRRKVYTRRLQQCKDLYRFVLDTRDRS